jgi:prepilin-type N-terminal cleavage/methylation domain-containing protein
MKYFLNKLNFKNKKAFTLIELLVVLGIVAIIAAISINSYPKFSEQMGVTTETYKLLAFLKETQTYGINSYGSPGVKFVYGVKIDKTGNIKRVKWESPTSSKNSDYVTNLQELSGDDTFSIKDLYEVKNICIDDNCSSDNLSLIDKVYILYKRPNPEARIITLEGTNIQPGANTESQKKIVILLDSKKDKNISKKVVVLKTGQAYVGDW